MTEATGYEAQTIHRLLELNGVPDEDGRESQGVHFERNAENPLDTDVIIIDEMSMVDIFLMQSLLKAIPYGTRLILVGDRNQLPSVGPGQVMRDLLESRAFASVCLETLSGTHIRSGVEKILYWIIRAGISFFCQDRISI